MKVPRSMPWRWHTCCRFNRRLASHRRAPSCKLLAAALRMCNKWSRRARTVCRAWSTTCQALFSTTTVPRFLRRSLPRQMPCNRTVALHTISSDMRNRSSAVWNTLATLLLATLRRMPALSRHVPCITVARGTQQWCINLARMHMVLTRPAILSRAILSSAWLATSRLYLFLRRRFAKTKSALCVRWCACAQRKVSVRTTAAKASRACIDKRRPSA
mmetsp:Transcript_104544/g.294588  ORF Transcript_104544/g.294588 Transcript_104544/m.294588 type:complete len:216 (-) Transcript_104544:780-1427(-)